jgi:putative NADH-flavin reductase
MKFLLLGATGGVGKHLLAQALERGDEVTVLVRNPTKLQPQDARVKVIQGDVFNKDDVMQAVAGQEAVVSCLNTSRGIHESDELQRMIANVVAAMTAHGVKRIVYCASAGIYNEMPGEMGKKAMEVLRHPLYDHAQAVAAIKAANLDFTIARPLGLTDAPLTGQYQEALEGVPSGGYTITRADVAHFMLKALHDDSYIGTSPALAN